MVVSIAFQNAVFANPLIYIEQNVPLRNVFKVILEKGEGKRSTDERGASTLFGCLLQAPIGDGAFSPGHVLCGEMKQTGDQTAASRVHKSTLNH